jgi:hypothetical protein
MDAEVVYDDAMSFDAPEEIAKLYAAYAEWAKSESNRLDVLMRHEITRELALYSSRMFEAYALHHKNHTPLGFGRQWIDTLTRILIRKRSS